MQMNARSLISFALALAVLATGGGAITCNVGSEVTSSGQMGSPTTSTTMSAVECGGVEVCKYATVDMRPVDGARTIKGECVPTADCTPVAAKDVQITEVSIVLVFDTASARCCSGSAHNTTTQR
jgi:hypothetical protein